MSDWDIALAWISRAKSICDQLKTSTGYRPSEREFQDTLDNCSPDVILKLLKTSNSLGTVMHSIVGHGYVDLVRCALEAVRGEDVLSLLMLPSDTAMTGEYNTAGGGGDIALETVILFHQIITSLNFGRSLWQNHRKIVHSGWSKCFMVRQDIMTPDERHFTIFNSN